LSHKKSEKNSQEQKKDYLYCNRHKVKNNYLNVQLSVVPVNRWQKTASNGRFFIFRKNISLFYLILGNNMFIS
jgi:ribosomal protein S5